MKSRSTMRKFATLAVLGALSCVGSARADTVDVVMSEWKLRMPAFLYLDDTVFRIKNNGAAPHNFLIHNTDSSVFYFLKDGDGALWNLEPGETRLMVTRQLDPTYQYKAMCPLDEHDDLGIVSYFGVLARTRRVSEVRASRELRAHAHGGTLKLSFTPSPAWRELEISDYLGKSLCHEAIPPGESAFETAMDAASGLLFLSLDQLHAKVIVTP